MVNRVALISCVKSKRDSAHPARDLYTSALFLGMRAYAERHADTWFILSAEHGLLRPDQVIAPYEKTLNAMPKEERANWTKRVGQALFAELQPGASVLMLARKRYREDLVPLLHANGFKVEVPMEGLKLGYQLRWLKAHTTHG